MAKGGYRPGAGRPKGAKNKKPEAAVPADIRKAARQSKLSPLDYMLAVMNDEDADAARRDRMAIAAAPFCHAKPSEVAGGKKESAQEAAKTAGVGSSWGDDLMAPAVRAN